MLLDLFKKKFPLPEDEPKEDKATLILDLKGGSFARIGGDKEWIESLVERLDRREESYIRTVFEVPSLFGYGEYREDRNYWIPDVVSYSVDWRKND